jgi:hypothetical protein
VTGNYYGITYRGSSSRGYLKTVSINSSGIIGGTVISALTFDSTTGYEPVIARVTTNIYAIAYRGSRNGRIKTVSINSSGVIGSSAISTLVFESANSYLPDLLQVTSNTYAVAYGISTNRGYLKTISIAPDGTITPTAIDTLNFDASACYEPSMVHVSGDIYAIAYRGPSNDGFVKTIGISSGDTAAAYRIVSTAGSTTIDALVDTDNTTASIVSWQIQ